MTLSGIELRRIIRELFGVMKIVYLVIMVLSINSSKLIEMHIELVYMTACNSCFKKADFYNIVCITSKLVS